MSYWFANMKLSFSAILKRCLPFLLCLLSLSCSSTSRLPGWTFLGERTVNHALDRDEIRVGVHAGTFHQIKLLVRRRRVDFRDVRLQFANGGVQDVPLRASIPAGAESRAIDLNGQDRIVRSVVFSYRKRRRGGKRAVVLLYGR